MSVDRAPAPSSDREERIEKAVDEWAELSNEQARIIELEEALFRCAKAAGADVSEGRPTWPDIVVWAVRAVKELRRDYDEGEIPAPDEVAVAAKRLVDTIDEMQKGAEKMGGQWYFPNPVLEDRDALRAALNEQDRASLPKGKEDRK